METQPILASKKRIFLAWYLDFILFMVFWSLLNHFLFSGRELPFWMGLFIFGLLEFVCIKFFGSIGVFFLSVDESHQVDPNIYKRENWLTILLGVLFILEGTKKLVRWIDLSVAHPTFGMFLDPNIQIIINILTGILFLVVALLLSVNLAMASSIESEIREFAKRGYPNDSRMQQYTYNRQVAAYNYLVTVKDSEVKEFASREYPTD